jgi:hypothetical protein
VKSNAQSRSWQGGDAIPSISAHDVIQIGQVAVRFHLDAAQTNAYFTMFEFSVAPKARVPVPIAATMSAGGPPDVARIMAVMQRHGLHPAPPAA